MSAPSSTPALHEYLRDDIQAIERELESLTYAVHKIRQRLRTLALIADDVASLEATAELEADA